MSIAFYRPKEININEFFDITHRFEAELNKLASGRMSETELCDYVLELLKCVGSDEIDRSARFWSYANPREMPGDAREDFFYYPTYLAVSFITRAVLLLPALMNDEPLSWEHASECRRLLREVLPAAMRCSTGMGFCGHGYDSTSGLLMTLRLFALGGIPSFLRLYPELCPEFTKLYNDTVANLRDCLAKGGVYGMWGEDYTDQVRDVLASLDENG